MKNRKKANTQLAKALKCLKAAQELLKDEILESDAIECAEESINAMIEENENAIENEKEGDGGE